MANTQRYGWQLYCYTPDVAYSFNAISLCRTNSILSRLSSPPPISHQLALGLQLSSPRHNCTDIASDLRSKVFVNYSVGLC